MSKDTKRTYRSAAWFGKHDKDGFIHRSWMRNQGLPADVFDGRPVVGICNTWSELTPCNAHLRDFAEHVKRGVWESGGLPVEFPVMSTGESNMRPTAMLFRNLASMDVEEAIRATMQADKMNLASLGNMTPHVHWHVIPRFRDDRHFPGPIWAAPQREAVRVPAREERAARLGAALLEKLSR